MNYRRGQTIFLLAAFFCLVFAAGFSLSGRAQLQHGREIALTFDDLPLTKLADDHAAQDLQTTRYVTKSILAVLKKHHAATIGFVNEVKLNVPGERDARVTLMNDWLDAGMTLGNHTYSHEACSTTPLAEMEDQIVRGDTITRSLLAARGLKETYFRHPYLDTCSKLAKKQAFDAFLAAHGYRTAPITVQDEDWMMNAPFIRAQEQHNVQQQKRVVQAYLKHTEDSLAYAESESRDSFHREIPQVILMHADILNAAHLDDILTLIEKRGYRYITLDQAMADSAYSTPDLFVGDDELTWLDRLQLALGRPMPTNEPQPPKWVQDAYDQITTEIQKRLGNTH